MHGDGDGYDADGESGSQLDREVASGGSDVGSNTESQGLCLLCCVGDVVGTEKGQVAGVQFSQSSQVTHLLAMYGSVHL